ncbi:MAG: hypothetical protein HY706_04535 [Candidatus Hydrogenedentes bacterium]|nr:hypothetical protein [Candidatus Hydrogenedentota bacterium]
MRRIRPISRLPRTAQLGGGFTGGNLSFLEQIVLLLFSTIFQQWDNFAVVAQNLQKFYRKTPD